MRLIDKMNRSNFDTFTFKKWIIQHNPDKKWDFDNPTVLAKQFADNIKESGDIDLKSIFHIFFSTNDPGFTNEQNAKFLNSKY